MIWRLRREGKTYREIAQELTNFGVHVSYTAVFKFVRARKRRILASKLPDLPSERLRAGGAEGAQGTGVPVSSPAALPARQRARPEAEVAPASVAPPAGPAPLPRPPLRSPKRILGSDGKEIANAQYAPANPDNL